MHACLLIPETLKCISSDIYDSGMDGRLLGWDRGCCRLNQGVSQRATFPRVSELALCGLIYLQKTSFTLFNNKDLSCLSAFKYLSLASNLMSYL